MRLVLLFIFMPLIELALLFQVHRYLSNIMGGFNAFFGSIAIIIFTGVVGANLAKKEGFDTLSRLQAKVQQGAEPSQELIEGLLILIGGLLLLTPGYLSDLLGFSLVIPVTRKIISKFFSNKILKMFKSKSNNFFFVQKNQSFSGFNNQGSNVKYQQSQVIDEKNVIDISVD